MVKTKMSWEIEVENMMGVFFEKKKLFNKDYPFQIDIYWNIILGCEQVFFFSRLYRGALLQPLSNTPGISFKHLFMTNI